ncbi:hypothetical protein BLD48_05770 [Exiguobacterium sp. KRL4]|uniref:hypothetical protein n=1 Tax=Exiguobacterium sp. KRL4 TaxID=1914536 RepID=UPI0008F8A80A|nr:hypothetical protein [Exiguobacterium sp. KRL4]OIN67398.1 hypothetical protein BLD48_05770 [Exiguobacterium sp. KRL4]
MAVFDETLADQYVNSYVADPEEWRDTAPEDKQRYFNIAERTLSGKFRGYVIPIDAVHDFAATLATAFSDTNKLRQQGVSNFSLSGAISVGFKDGAKELDQLITKHIRTMVADANPDKPKPGGRVKWTVV